ncbi:hypothetical protein V5799_014984 [Amblyomma americanum]|uniref:Uncharacterized protein n=1 Tax=Amblyomma americanum TaxID=6943 RepID=A0AAQ4E1D7_AMBAM
MEERSVVLKEARARRWNNTKRRRRSEETEEERAIRFDKRRNINAAEKLERAVADSECTSSDEDEDEEGSASESERLELWKSAKWFSKKRGLGVEQHGEEAAIRGDGAEPAIRFDKRRNISAAEKLERAVADSECTSSDEDEDEEESASETERLELWKSAQWFSKKPGLGFGTTRRGGGDPRRRRKSVQYASISDVISTRLRS